MDDSNEARAALAELQELMNRGSLRRALARALVILNDDEPEDDREVVMSELAKIRELALDLSLFLSDFTEAARLVGEQREAAEISAERAEQRSRVLRGACRLKDFEANGRESPSSLTPPDPVSQELIEAMILDAKGQLAVAERRYRTARSGDWPVPSGRFEHRTGRIEVECFSDLDDLSATALIALSGESLLWIPWDQIAALEVLEPRDRFEALLRPAVLKLEGGLEGRIEIPLVYSRGAGKQEEALMSSARFMLEQRGSYNRPLGWRSLRLETAEGEMILPFRDLKSFERSTNRA